MKKLMVVVVWMAMLLAACSTQENTQVSTNEENVPVSPNMQITLEGMWKMEAPFLTDEEMSERYMEVEAKPMMTFIYDFDEDGTVTVSVDEKATKQSLLDWGVEVYKAVLMENGYQLGEAEEEQFREEYGEKLKEKKENGKSMEDMVKEAAESVAGEYKYRAFENGLIEIDGRGGKVSAYWLENDVLTIIGIGE